MIIKLNSLTSISRQREESIPKTLTRADRIKGDRVVVMLLFIITTIVAAVFA